MPLVAKSDANRVVIANQVFEFKDGSRQVSQEEAEALQAAHVKVDISEETPKKEGK